MKTVIEEVKIVAEGLIYFYGQTQALNSISSRFLPDAAVHLQLSSK
jgi:hypothetical protein